MKYKIVIGLSFLTLGVLINSCENKTTPLPAASTPTFACSQASDTVGLTYSSGTNTMQAIINVQCGVTGANGPSCHGPHGASSYDYSTYSGIQINYTNGTLYQALFASNFADHMPKTPQPGWDNCMLAQFKAWINAGCPQ